MSQVDIIFNTSVEEKGLNSLKNLEILLKEVQKNSTVVTKIDVDLKDFEKKMKELSPSNAVKIALDLDISNLELAIAKTKELKVFRTEANKNSILTKGDTTIITNLNKAFSNIYEKIAKVLTQQYELWDILEVENKALEKKIELIELSSLAKKEELDIAKELTAQALKQNELKSSTISNEDITNLINQISDYSKKLDEVLEKKTKIKEPVKTEKEKEKVVTTPKQSNNEFKIEKENKEKLLNLYKSVAQEEKNFEMEKASLRKDQANKLFKLEMDLIKSQTQNTFFIHKNGLAQTHMERLNDLKKMKNLKDEELDYFEKSVKKMSAVAQGDKARFTQNISQFMFFKQAGSGVTKGIKEMFSFEDAVYQTGIISGKSLVEIKNLRNEMIELGSVIPRVTQEITEQIGEVVRTGRTYEEAFKIVTKASQLAIVSGESLTTSVNTLNDVMNSFDISTSRTAKTMDTLHSATKATPLNFRAIADGMKNSASAMRNFIESTDKSGVELDDYKDRILELTTALIGNQMVMGRTASSAGLSVRNLTSKLIVLEDNAKNLFDTEMSLNKVRIDNLGNITDMNNGYQLTADLLSDLAQRDLPKALELLSQLSITGEVSNRTLSKMFTGRQAPFITTQLTLMGGNIEEYVDNVTKMGNVSDDVKKAMENWTVELKLLKNNLQGTKASLSGFMDYIGKDTLHGINKAISGLNSMSSETSALSSTLGVAKDSVLSLIMVMSAFKLLQLTSQFTGLTAAISGFATATKTAGTAQAFKGLLTSANLVKITIMALVLGISAYVSFLNRKKELEAHALLSQEKYNRELEEMKKKTKSTEALLKTQIQLYEEIVRFDWVTQWEKGYDIIGATVSKMSELVELMKMTKNLESIIIPEFDTGIGKRIKEEYNISGEFIDTDKVFKKRDIVLKDLASFKILEQFPDSDKYFKDVSNYINKANKNLSEYNKKIDEIREKQFEDKADLQKVSEFLNTKVMGSEWADSLPTFEEFSKLMKNSRVVDSLKGFHPGGAFAKLFNVYTEDELYKNAYNVGINQVRGFEKAFKEFKGASFGDVLLDGDLIQAKKLVDILTELKSAYAPQALEIYNERIQQQATEVLNVTEAINKYINYMDRVKALYTDLNMTAFNRLIDAKEVTTIEEYIKVAEKANLFYVGEGDIKKNTKEIINTFLEELRVEAGRLDTEETELDLDILVTDKKLMEYVTIINSIDKSIESLSTGIKNLNNTTTDYSTEQTEELWKVLENPIKELSPNKTITKEEFVQATKDKIELDKMLKYLLEEGKKSKQLQLEWMVLATYKSGAALKDYYKSLFFYYDETELRRLQLQESETKGLANLEIKRDLLEEEMNIAKAKYEFDMKANKLGATFINGDLSEANIEATRKQLEDRKIELERQGLSKENEKEYDNTKASLTAVETLLKTINDHKKKGINYDETEKNTIETTRKYYSELAKSYEELTLAKDISEYDDIKNKEKELKQVVKSRSELINSIKDKQSELLQLSQNEKEIDKEKQDELNRELAIYKQILSLMDSITDRLTKQTEEIKNNANSLAEELNELFKSLEYKPARKVANESIEEFKKQYEVTSSSNLYDGKEKIDIKGYKDVINALRQQQEIIDDITVKVGEYNDELSKPTTSEERKNQLEKELELLEQQLVIEKELNKQGLKTTEDQKKANKELQDSISEIAQLAQTVLSGEGVSFTGGFVSKGLDSLGKLIGGNLAEGFEKLTEKDYANIIGLSIETLNANLNRGLEASKQQLELDLLMLDLRKQFLRTEEDINANSREILEKQKKQAELEAMQSTAFMGNTGMGASAVGGATQGAVAGAVIGGGIGAVIGGALGLFGGILGGSTAKKQAAAQKKQLELQFVANALLDRQNRLIEEMTNAVDKMINTTYLGIERSIKQALEGIVTAPTHTLDLEYRKTRKVGYMSSPHGLAPILNPADIAYNERAEAHNAKVKDLIESYETLKNMDLSNIGSIGNLSIYDDVGNLVKNATGYLKDIETIIEALHSYDGDKEVIDFHISSLVRYQEELLVIKKIAEESADIFYGSAFGFEIEKVTDSLGNLEGLKLGKWNVREEIIKKFSDGSYSAGQSIAESFIDGFNYNLTIEDEEVQGLLDDIEASFKESFKLKLEFDDNSIEELRGENGRLYGELYSISTKLKQNLTPEERAYYMGLQQPLIAEKNKVEDELDTQLQAQRDYNVTLQGIVAKTERLKEAQKKNQESVYETNQLWLENGGSLSDIKNKLSEISKSLYDTLASGDFTALGSTIGSELSKGIADTIKDSFLNIFDLETQINELISSTTNFDDSWLATAKQKMSLGEQFNDLTIEQVRDTDLMRSYLKEIGYEEKDINNELIQQVQKMLSIKILSEEIANSEKETLTLKGMINDSQSKLNTLIEQYVTKLYNGTFNEIELNTLLEERHKLLQMETEERLLITSVMVQMAQKGVAINEIISHLPQNLQEALNTIVNINYAMQDTSKELSVSDKLWNSQVASIRDTLKAKLMSAKYSEDLASIDNKVLEIQQAVTSEKEKQIRIDSLQERINDSKKSERLDKLALQSADISNLSQEGRQKLQDSINEAKELQLQLQNELTSVIANKPLEVLQQELTGLIEGLGNTLENDTDLKRIDELFADKVLNGDSLTESYKSIFARLNEQSSKFTETLEFWFRGGLKLIGDDITEDWKKTIEEVNTEFYKMKELEQSIAEDQTVLLNLWKDGTIKASLSDIVDKLGNMANTVKNSLTNALSSKGYLNIATTLGNEISQAIATGWNDDIINNKLKNEYVDLITQANTAMMSGSLADINKLSMEMQSVASKIEYENIRQQALLDLFNYNAEINYATQNTQIDYSTGTTKENVYNITYNTNVTTGALVTDSFSGAQKVTDQLAINIINSLEKHGKKF